jgi:ferredoxin
MVELPTVAVAPDPPRGPDLLRLPGLRRFVRWRYARLALQLPILLLALFVVVDGLTGRPLAPRNVATTAVWLHYRGLVVLALLVAGNLFCAACPLMLTRGAARWTKRLLGGDRRWPDRLRSKGLAIGLMFAFFYAYEAFALWSSPWLTAWLVVGYFGAAWVVDTLFPAGTFCRYVCPLGNFNFVLASAAPTQLATVDPGVCDRCVAKPCLHGRVSDAAAREGAWRGSDGTLRDAVDGPRRASFVPLEEVVAPNGVGRFPGCETGLFVPQLTSNLDCTLCLNCVRACPYDNVALRVRAPWREAVRDGWRHRGRRSALLLGTLLAVWGVMNAFAMVPPYFAAAEGVAAALGTRATWLVLALMYGAATAAGLGLALGAAWLADRAGGRRNSAWVAFDRWGYVFVLLGVGFWAAHYLFHFLTGAWSIVPVFQHFFEYRGAAVDPNWRLAQLVPSRWLFPVGAAVVSVAATVALVATVRIALRDFGRRGLLAMWLMGLVVVLATVGEVLLLGLPMEMRGTLLGPL